MEQVGETGQNYEFTSIQGQSDQLKICLQLVYEAKRNWETTSTPIR